MKKVKLVLKVLSIFAMIGGAMMMANKIFMYGFNSNKQPEVDIIYTATDPDDIWLDFGNGKQPEIIEVSKNIQTDNFSEHPSNVNHDEEV